MKEGWGHSLQSVKSVARGGRRKGCFCDTEGRFCDTVTDECRNSVPRCRKNAPFHTSWDQLAYATAIACSCVTPSAASPLLHGVKGLSKLELVHSEIIWLTVPSFRYILRL